MFSQIENTYDSLGRATGSTYVVNGKEMSYDITYKADSSLVASVGMPDADILMSAINYTYDNFDRLTTKDISLSNMTDIYEDYAYYTYTGTDDKTHTTSLVSSVTLRISSGGTTTSTVYSYTYDNLGNISSVSKNGVAQANYGYDNLGQLVTEIDRVANKVYSYSYDKAGNILSKTTYDFSTANVLGSVSYTYSDSAWGDLLTNYNGTTINYDAIGNPTNWHNSSSLTWDARQLEMQKLSNDDWIRYTYNSSGIRTRKEFFRDVESCFRTYDYVLDGTKILIETVVDELTNENYTLYYLYDASGSVQGFIYNNAYYYYQKNLQGDVVRIVNSGGTVVVDYTYDAWGNVLSVTGSLADTIGHYNPFRYRSYYYDTETGWYYLQSRYYDPTVGRFLNADGLICADRRIIANNLYIYCLNNPICRVDTDGKSSMKIEGEDFEFDGVNTFSVEDKFYTSYGTITINVEVKYKIIPDLAISIDDFTMKMDKKSITVTELNGVDLRYDYDFVNSTLEFKSASGEIDDVFSWDVSENGLGVGVTAETETFDITYTFSIKPNILSTIAKFLESISIPGGTIGGGGGCGVVNNAQVMYRMGGGRFNLLGCTDLNIV